MIKILSAICFIFTSLYATENSLPKDQEIQKDKSEIPFFNDQTDSFLNFLNLGEHCVIAKYSDRLVEIEDGTKFKVCDRDWKEFKTWDIGDLIVLYPRHPRHLLLGAPQFFIVNKENKSSIAATIWSSPGTENSCAFYLDAIDMEREEVVLSTQKGEKMRWKIDSDDFQAMDGWKIGDRIVVGKNKVGSNKYFPYHPYILVNHPAIETLHCILGTPMYEPSNF